MKICLVANAKSIHIRRWAQWLSGKGHDVHVLSYEAGEIEDAKTHFIGPFHAPESVNYRSITQLIRITSKARSIIKSIKPDIVHGHYLQDSAFFAARAGFHPLVVSAWGSDVLIFPFSNRIYGIMTRYVLRKADAIHSVGGHLTEKLVELGAKQERILTLPMGVDTSIFGSNEEHTDKDGNIIVSTRSLEAVYNLQLLIKAVPYIVKEVDDARIVIVGDGQDSESLKSLSRDLKVEKHIDFIGAVEYKDIPKWLNSAKVYVSTSLSDGTSNSLLEAMACGTFPVVSDIEANRPWIHEGKNGFLVPTDDPRVLADRVVRGLKDGGLRELAKDLNAKLTKEKGNWHANMKRIEQLYSSLGS